MNREQARQRLQQRAQEYRERQQEIRDNWTTSLEKKKLDWQELFTEFHSEWTEVVNSYREGIQSRIREAQHDAWKAPVTSSTDLASNAQNYRAAILTAAQATDGESLRALLQQADITRDEALGRAVAYRAWTLQSHDVVNDYLEAWPQAQDNVYNVYNTQNELKDLNEYGPTLVLEAVEPQPAVEIQTDSQRMGGGGFQVLDNAEPVPSGMATSSPESKHVEEGVGLTGLLDSISTKAPEEPEEATEESTED